jgi:hypothetical protein
MPLQGRADRHRETRVKKIGIVGGLAWPSTVQYYSELCRRSEQWHLQRNLPLQTPEIAIESLNLAKAFSYIGSDGDEASWARFDAYHRTALERPRGWRSRLRPDGRQHSASSF